MRLFLHGRSGKTMLLKQLNEAQEKQDDNNNSSSNGSSNIIHEDSHDRINSKRSFSSASSSITSSSSNSSTNTYYSSSILLSNWNVDDMDDDVLNSFEEFLLKNQQQKRQQQQSNRKQQQKRQRLAEEEQIFIDDNNSCSIFSSISSQLSAISSYDEEESINEVSISESIFDDDDGNGDSYADDDRLIQRRREVILHNCTGEERMERLVVLLMETCSSMTIRYDKQREFPNSIARGLHVGANTIDCCQLRSLTFKGMTITPSVANHLQFALPLLPMLVELTLQGKFTLMDVNRKLSIAGDTTVRGVLSQVAVSLHNMLKELSLQLKVLDLSRCHLPDDYLALILDGLCCAQFPTSTIETLKLHGNMVQDEVQTVLCSKILSRANCHLQHLDLSWQRLPNSKRNHSMFDTRMLSHVLGGASNNNNKNTSLRTLNLSQNRLLDKDVAQLSIAISNHPTLRKVVLQNCYMTDQAIITLANQLPACSENLNSMSIDGAQQIRNAPLVRNTILNAVLKNVYLRELAVPLSCESEVLSWALEFNCAGRRALLDDASSSLVPKKTNDGIVAAEYYCPAEYNLAIECTIHSSVPFIESQRSNSNHQIEDSIWPIVYERADRIARQTYCSLNEQESSTSQAASTLYLLLREKGYHSLLQR